MDEDRPDFGRDAGRSGRRPAVVAREGVAGASGSRGLDARRATLRRAPVRRPGGRLPPGPWRRRHLPALAALAVLAACTLASFSGVLLEGESLYLRDLGFFHRPLRAVLVVLREQSAGLPAWNPYSSHGQPFAANPNSAALHPATLAYGRLPFEAAFHLEILSTVVVAFAAAWLLLRRLGRSTAAALLGSACWAFGGAFLSATTFLQLAHCIAWLPATLCFARGVARSGSSRDACGLALCFGMQGLAGSPSGLVATALLLPFAVADGVAAARRGRDPKAGAVATGSVASAGAVARTGPVTRPAPARAVATLLAAGILLGALIGAAVTWPAWRHLELSRLAAGARLDAAESGAWSLPPLRLVELLVPRAFGHVVPESVGWYWGGGLYEQRWPYLYSVYAGQALLPLALVAATRWRRELAWIAAGTLTLVLAFGQHLPGWDVLHSVPPLSFLRYPEKLAVAPALVLCVLGSRGLDVIFRRATARAPGPAPPRPDGGRSHRARSARTGRLALAAGHAVLAAAALLAAGASLVVESREGPSFWTGLGLPDWLAPLAGDVVRLDLLVVAAVATGLVVALGIAGRRPRAGLAVLLAVTLVDLVVAGRELLPTRPAAELTTPPSLLRPLVGSASEGSLFHFASWRPGRLERGGRVAALDPPVTAQWGIATVFEQDFDRTLFAWSRQATRFALDAMAEEPDLVAPLLRRRSVLAVLRLRDGVQAPLPEPGQGPLELLRVAEPQPLAFAARRVVRIGSPGERRAALRALGSAAARSVVVEDGLDPASGGGLRAAPRPASARVETVERTPVDWILDVGIGSPASGVGSPASGSGAGRAEAAGPAGSAIGRDAVVAINQAWSPHWHAFLDGRPVELHRVDVDLSAVRVPPGEHRLELRYDDPALGRGLVLCLVGLAGTLVLFLGGARRSRGPGAARVRDAEPPEAGDSALGRAASGDA